MLRTRQGGCKAKMNIIVTGGAGFIGSVLVRYLLNETDHKIWNLDRLTYAGNLLSLRDVSSNERYKFVYGDICDEVLVKNLFKSVGPDAIIHLAAESHVDRSIEDPNSFIQTNVMGTLNLLNCSREYVETNSLSSFCFHHVSTDEVFGDLDEDNSFFTENSLYQPSSPYSASKASSDHLVRAYSRTYGLPIKITNCSNNYGPYQFPEKLIPKTIICALQGKPIPVYGNGEQIRDWLYVEDHAAAIYKVLNEGKVNETFLIGGFNEKTNISVVTEICSILNRKVNNKAVDDYLSLITHVTDRPGHDTRYAIDSTKLSKVLGWKPKQTFETGLEKTIDWYLNNQSWVQSIEDGSYVDFNKANRGT